MGWLVAFLKGFVEGDLLKYVMHLLLLMLALIDYELSGEMNSKETKVKYLN